MDRTSRAGAWLEATGAGGRRERQKAGRSPAPFPSGGLVTATPPAVKGAAEVAEAEEAYRWAVPAGGGRRVADPVPGAA